MTARLTYAVNYANSYGMRSFVRFQQQRREREKWLNETQEGKEGKERRREREREKAFSAL